MRKQWEVPGVFKGISEIEEGDSSKATSQVSDLCSGMGLYIQYGSIFDLILTCHYLEILKNSWTRDLRFYTTLDLQIMWPVLDSNTSFSLI